MPIDVDTRQQPPRSGEGRPEPLRRKRVQPAAAASPLRRKLLNGLLAFAAVVLLIDALVGDKGLLEGLRARRAYQQTQASLHGLRAENARLLEEMRRLRDDRSAIEALARDQLGYIKPGEVVFIVRDATPAPR